MTEFKLRVHTDRRLCVSAAAIRRYTELCKPTKAQSRALWVYPSPENPEWFQASWTAPADKATGKVYQTTHNRVLFGRFKAGSTVSCTVSKDGIILQTGKTRPKFVGAAKEFGKGIDAVVLALPQPRIEPKPVFRPTYQSDVISTVTPSRLRMKDGTATNPIQREFEDLLRQNALKMLRENQDLTLDQVIEVFPTISFGELFQMAEG